MDLYKDLINIKESWSDDQYKKVGETVLYHQLLEDLLDDYIDRNLNVDSLPYKAGFKTKLDLCCSIKDELNIIPHFRQQIAEFNNYRNKIAHHKLNPKEGSEIIASIIKFNKKSFKDIANGLGKNVKVEDFSNSTQLFLFLILLTPIYEGVEKKKIDFKIRKDQLDKEKSRIWNELFENNSEEIKNRLEKQDD